MTATQKHQAFLAVCSQVREIERRYKNERIQRQAQAIVEAHMVEYRKQRDEARKYGSFSFLK